MLKRATTGTTEKRLFSIEELQQYLSLGRTRASEVGAAAGATVKIGRRKLFDKVKIDSYIERL